MAKVFLACPTHDNRIISGAARGLHAYPTQRHEGEVLDEKSSLLPYNCNRLWAVALNRHRRNGTEWFAMLHSDVVPESFWLDKLIDEALRAGADVLSVVCPIKDDSGLTSTAIAHPTDEFQTFCHLTMSQVLHPSFPKTFDLEAACKALEELPPPLRVSAIPRTKLLCNTGCVLIRLGDAWCDPRKVFFHERDEIRRMGDSEVACVLSEDWFFTSRAAAQGAKVMATTVVAIDHIGYMPFPNQRAWGKPSSAGRSEA